MLSAAATSSCRGIERRYRPLALWGGLFLISVLLAVLSTIGVNR